MLKDISVLWTISLEFSSPILISKGSQTNLCSCGMKPNKYLQYSHTDIDPADYWQNLLWRDLDLIKWKKKTVIHNIDDAMLTTQSEGQVDWTKCW